MAERIEIPVSLGLKDAMEQAAELRKILTADIKPNTHSYDVILKTLNKIDAAAGSLKGKMATAFQTSKGSQSFLREYEKLSELLTNVKDQFANVGLSELKLSAADTKQVEDYTRKIRALEEQLNAVQNGGKLGGFFNADEFKTAKNLLDQLKIDPSKFTFQGLQDELRKQLGDASKLVDDLNAQFNNVDSVIANLGKGNLANLNDELKKATENADGLARKITDNKEQIDVNKRLRDAFASNSALNLSISQIKQNESVSDFVDKETTRIKEAFNRRIAELTHLAPQIQDALKKLGDKATAPLDWKTLKANIESNDVKKLFSDLGMEKAYQQYIKGINSKTDADGIALAAKMRKTIQDVNNVVDLETTRDMLVSEVEKTFKTAGNAVVTSATPFKKALQEVFENNNVDIKGTGVENIIAKIKDGDDVATIIDNITKSLEAYVAVSGHTTVNNQNLIDRKADLQQIVDALNAVVKAEQDVSTNIPGKQGEIASFRDLIQKIMELAQKGIKIPVDKGDLDKGRTALEQFLVSITKLEGKQKSLGNVQSAVTRWMGFYQVLNLTKRAINDMKQHIQELDTVMTKIAVVTNMTQSDLWNQIGKYSEIARQYGVAIKGVYEVSQIYYQQGLNKGDVMGLTTETLKMARIAGIDYATAADYMTTAIRGFKLEMSDAAHVTDVFSNLAAHTASSTEELATAISKTAASAASVGASFEATSAMMATMIATTRESATNIGTALKSIISRYGEMKENPEGKDSEGEEYSLNKVDTALQSIGISIHDVNGEFRDFDDVILELGEKWSTIDKNAQRYIATVMAGNRQQSRFLALVSNVEEYKRALELAQDSENVGDLQTLKTLDSIDAKIERMKVTVQEFYTSSGIQDMYKNILDIITNVISAANDMPKAFGNIPVTAMAVGMSIVSTIKNVLTLIIASIQTSIEHIKANNSSALQGLVARFGQAGEEAGQALQKGIEKHTATIGSSLGKSLSGIIMRYAGAAASVLGSNFIIGGMNKYGASTTEAEDRAAGTKMLGGFGLNVIGGALSGAASGAAMGAAAGPAGIAIGAALGGISSLITNIGSLVSGIDMLNVSLARQIELSKKRLETAKTEETKAKTEQKELTSSYEKLIQLQEHQFDSTDAAKEYADYMNQLAETYPQFVEQISATGDAIIDAERMEQALAEARLKTANATLTAVKAEQDQIKLELENYNNLSTGISTLQKDNLYDEERIYKLLFNRPAAGSRNRATSIVEQYNNWAQAMGHEVANIVPQGYQTENDAARAWMKTHTANLNAFMEASLSAYDMSSDLGNYQKEALNGARNSLAERFIALLKETQEAAEKTGKTLDLKYLTDEDIESLDDIKSWGYNKIKSTLEKTKDRIQNYINSTNDTLKQVNAAIIESEIKSAVQISLSDLRNTGKEGLKKSTTLQSYSDLMTNMLAGRYNYSVDWTAEKNANIIKELEEWVYTHQDEATQLMNLDYNQYRSLDEIDFESLTKDMPSASEYIEKSFKPAFEAARATVTAGLETQLKNAKLDTSSLADLIDESVDNGELVNTLIPSLRSGITEYSKLAKNGLSSVANNYLKSLQTVYTTIGNLKSDQQVEIASIITTLDFSDKDNLLKAAEQLRELGYEDLAIQLEDAAARLVTNIGIGLQSLQENTSEIAKELEKVADKFGKGVKYSEALEAVSKLDTKLSFDELYEYSEAAKGWVLTQVGIDETIQSIIKENQKKADDLKSAAERRSGTLESLIKGHWLTLSLTQESFQDMTDLEGTDLETEYANYQQLAQDFKDSGETNFRKYLEEQLKQNNKYLEQINQITEDTVPNVVSGALIGINYSDIARGKDLTVNKSLITSVLSTLPDITKEQLNQFDTEIWPEMLKGHFTAYNNFLSNLGLKAKVSNTQETEAQSANVEQYVNGVSELLTKSTNAFLSDETIALLDEAGIDIGNTSRKEAAQQLVGYVKSLMDKGEATIEQYNSVLEVVNNSIADNTNKALGNGRTKAVLDMAKDGITIDELKNFANTYHEELIDFIDEDTHTITNSALAGIMEYDSDTGVFKFKGNASAEQILAALTGAFGITIDNYTQAVSETIASQIAKQDENDVEKQATNALSNLFSAKIGTRLDVSQIPELKEKFGNIYQVTSEYARDTMILALDPYTYGNGAYASSVLAQQESVRNKRQAATSAKTLLSQNLNMSTARSYLAQKYGARDENLLTEDKIKEFMKNDAGYIWDSINQQFIATEDTLKWYDELIAAADDGTEESKAAVAQLRTERAKIEHQLAENPLQSALISALSSYSNISDDTLSDLEAKIKTYAEVPDDFDIDQYITEENGVKKLNVEALKALLPEYAQLFTDVIDQLKDEYISNAQKAGSLVTQGTTSMAEMTAFQTAYKELVGADIEFFYDPLIKAWTFDASQLKSYLVKAAEKTGLDSKGQKQWIKDQIDALTVDNLNFSSYLSGTSTKKEQDVLVRDLQNYFKTHTDGFMPYMGSIEEWVISNTTSTLNALSEGGQTAINALKNIKGELTTDEVEAAYRAQIEPLKALSDQLDDLQVGSVVAKNQIDALNAAGFKVNADGVVTSTGDLVAAYKSIYEQMKATNEATLAELNAAAGKYLDNRDGEQKVIDALSNATNMTYSQLAEIYTAEGREFSEEIADELENAGIIKHLGGSNIMIQDFKTFAKLMDWSADSEQYLSGMKSVNDAFVDRNRQYESEILAEAKSVTEAKIGDKINLTYLTDAISKNAPGIAEGLGDEFFALGATFKDGLLTINSGADIPGIMARIYEYSEKYGNLLPEELAELADAVAEFLANITSLITKGITSGLTRTEATNLSGWAKEHGIDKLDFIETADGLKLANNSAQELYHVMNQLDSLQGSIVFETLKDNLIETDERFKSATSNAAYIRSIESRGLTSDQQAILQNLNGNVDLFNRPVLQNADGSITTLFSGTEDSRNYESEISWVMNITPVTPAGKELNDTELQSYIQKLVEESSGNMNEMIKLDKSQLGLIIEGENTEIEQQEEILKAYDERAEKLHNISDAIEQNKQRSAEELALAQKIAEARGLQEDNSFKFMEQVIPSGQKNPLNYWENWAKAYTAINEAAKGETKGTMAYEDFYNLITEMGNLESITGQSIKIGENVKVNAENVASLIEQAGAALEVQSDGSLRVNLSKIGIDFAQGADAMGANIDAGIHEVAQSQIEMLDGLIGLLEAIVTMEDAFKNMDVDSDMKLSIDELFDVDGNFKGEWVAQLEDLKAMLDPNNLEKYNADFARGMESIKFTLNGQLTSLADIITETDFSKLGIGQNFYTALMNSIYQAAQSQDFSETNIKEILMRNLQAGMKDFGTDFQFDLGNYTFIGTATGAQFQIDWSADATQQAMDSLTTEADQQQKALINAYKARSQGNASFIQLQATLVADRIITVKDGKYYIKGPDGNTYTFDGSDKMSAEYKDAMAAATLTELGATDVEMGKLGECTADGYLQMGDAKVKVHSDNGKITYDSEDEDGITGAESPQDLVAQIVDKKLREEQEAANKAGVKNFDVEERRAEIQYETEVHYGVKITPIITMDAEAESKITKAIQDRAREAIANNKAGDLISIAKEIGAELSPKITPETDLTNLSLDELIAIEEAFKLESKNLILDATVNSNDKGFISLIEQETPTVDLNVNVHMQGEDAELLRSIINPIQPALNNILSEKEYYQSKLPIQQMGENSQMDKNTSTEVTAETSDAEKKFDVLLDKVNEYKSPIQKQLTIDNKTALERLEEIKQKREIIISQNKQKVEVGEDAKTNETTTEHLHLIFEHQRDIESKANLIIQVSAPEAAGVAAALGALGTVIRTIPKTVPIAVTLSVNGGLPGNILGVGNAITNTTKTIQQAVSSILGNQVTGNIGLAKAKGTLMGELGPELVVSKGQYFVAGQNGPEMVNLADDAIVFNHLQTESLLKKGTSNGRGQAITNERNAVAFASGNYSGPAMASASAVLSQLKQLRAMWQSILGSSVKDLAGMGGSGGGGGGEKADDPAARQSFLADVERWYNWLQRIAVLEEKINEEETKRAKYQANLIAQGKEYALSNLKTLDYLREQVAINKDLAESQQAYFEKRRSELNSSAFSKFYTFDEYGQLKYNNDALGFSFLSDLVARNDYGEAKYTLEEQYNKLIGAGMGAWMRYDNSGTEIQLNKDDNGESKEEDWNSFYSSSIQAFWDVVDGQKEEMQSLHDSVQEKFDAVTENQTKAYEVLKEIEDNQISVEDKVLAAIEDMRQRAIDELQKERDAIEKAASNLINGLTQQLQKERDMYSRQQNQDELTKLQRQLAILERSGGSAAQIASLQKEISQKQQDAYFDAQQAQIDALQEASDNELQKLDQQIELQTELLAYQKQYGLLWESVYEVLRTEDPQHIADFIIKNNSEYWKDSPTKSTQDMRNILFESEQFVTYSKNLRDDLSNIAKTFGEDVTKVTDAINAVTAAVNAANSSSGSSSSSGGSSGEGLSGGNDASSGGNNTPKETPTSGTTSEATKNLMKKIASADASEGSGYNQKKGVGVTSKELSASLGLESKPSTAATQQVKKDEEIKAAVTTLPAINSAKTSNIVEQTAKAVESAQKTVSAASTAIKTASTLVSAAKAATKKAGGGYVNHGIYELGELGTETVLTAEQTKVLRDNILSNRPNSLISLLKSYNEGYSGISEATQGIQQITDNSINIENATVEMHIDRLANDYDAQRAGEQALNKMLSIARKTSAQNRIGR